MSKVRQQEMEDLVSGDRLHEGDSRLQAKLARYSNLRQPSLMIGLAFSGRRQLRSYVDFNIPVREAEKIGPLDYGRTKVGNVFVREREHLRSHVETPRE